VLRTVGFVVLRCVVLCSSDLIMTGSRRLGSCLAGGVRTYRPCPYNFLSASEPTGS